jgi:proton glutamate symport protein
MLKTLRRVSLTGWIFLGMATGILVGWLAPGFAVELRPLSTVFLRMIKSVVVPIIFGTLVIGIAGHGDDLKRIGRLALKSIGYFWIMTTVALAVGLLAGNLVRPGAGVVLPPPDPNAPIPKAAPTVRRLSAHRSPKRGRGRRQWRGASGRFWATLFALALTQVKGRPKSARVCRGFDGGDVQVRRAGDDSRRSASAPRWQSR